MRKDRQVQHKQLGNIDRYYTRSLYPAIARSFDINADTNRLFVNLYYNDQPVPRHVYLGAQLLTENLLL